MLRLLLSLLVSGSIFSLAFQGLKYGKVWNAKIDSRLVSSSTTSLGVKPSVGDTVLAEVDDIVGTLDRPAIALKVHTYIHIHSIPVFHFYHTNKSYLYHVHNNNNNNISPSHPIYS